MRAKFDICFDEQHDLSAFDYGLRALMVEMGGGTFLKSEGPSSTDTKYEYECVSDNVRLTMNAVGTLAARHRLIEHLQGHELLSK